PRRRVARDRERDHRALSGIEPNVLTGAATGAGQWAAGGGTPPGTCSPHARTYPAAGTAACGEHYRSTTTLPTPGDAPMGVTLPLAQTFVKEGSHGRRRYSRRSDRCRWERPQPPHPWLSQGE